MKKKIFAVLFATAIVAGACAFMIMTKSGPDDHNVSLEILGTDKSMYSPGEKIKVRCRVSGKAGKDASDLQLTLKVTHLENVVFQSDAQPFGHPAGEDGVTELEWTAPDADFTGYLLDIGIVDGEEGSIASDTIGVDVSSAWVKFPRYGYLCDFGADIDAGEKIGQMTRYHINAIEYYDWQYLHHKPLPDGFAADSPGVWNDWSGREISGKTVEDCIRAGKERNMTNMAYNMIYAGTDAFFRDSAGNPTEANQWKLYFAEGNDRGKGEFRFHMGASPSGNGTLYFLNPLNKDWQRYIFSEMRRALTDLGFDGWHGDTVGDWGGMATALNGPLGYSKDGAPIYLVKETYTAFLNAAKKALGDKYLSFNPVGAQGIENVNVSRTDVLYTEFWPWDRDREGIPYDTYASLVREVERSREDSMGVSFDGKGKSLVVKAYINYNTRAGTMNAPGVLLCDAAVYAAGGGRLEVGNGDRMLHAEYYPNDNVRMDDELKNRMKRMADFTVTYENLLRDGQHVTENEAMIDGYAYGREGESDSIWTYTKRDDKYDILHMINLLGTDNQWRDEYGTKKAPEEALNLKVKYYTDRMISGIYLASPDRNDCRSEALPYNAATDARGSYVAFTVPSLQYWDMIYMK